MEQNIHHKIKYRPEIDGLRAIAVGVVLLYHAKLAMPGGFVGVDVFFVISGFLITSLILKDYESPDGFSIVGFWERRARRILPALMFVLLATAAAGWFILLPSDFIDLGKTVIAQSVFASNFYFWDTSGYFESSAWIRPLLHTWSLAVEEQFYLLLPLLFLSRSAWDRSVLRKVIGSLFVLSLVISVIQTQRSPDAAFYLLPSRTWELLAGVLLALGSDRGRGPRWLHEMAGWCGLALIGLACLILNHDTPFPGWAGLLPVAGTVAIIWSTRGSTPHTLRRLLAWEPLVFIGKISYSLYLWHWPVLVYALYWRDNHILHWPYRAGLLGLSLVLSVISWKFVETPFRTRKCFASRKGVLGFGFVLLLVCAAGGGWMVAKKGCPERFPEAVVRIDTGADPFAFDEKDSSNLESALQGKFLTAGKATAEPDAQIHCLVWGDSHAMAMWPAFDALGKQYAKTVQCAAHLATCPVLGYESFNETSLLEKSTLWGQAIVEHVRKKQIPHVVMIANWHWYYNYQQETSHEEFSAILLETTLALRQAGAKVWILKEVPAQTPHYRIAIAKALLAGKSANVGVAKSKHLKGSLKEDEIFALSRKNGAQIIDATPVFFAEGETSKLQVNGDSIYFDATHISKEGAIFLKQLFVPVFETGSSVGE